MLMRSFTHDTFRTGSLLFVTHLVVAAMVGVGASPQPLIVVPNDSSGSYIVNPPGDTTAWNEFPYGQPLCRSNISGLRTATGDNQVRVLLGSTYGLRISCLTVVAAELRTAGPSCPSSPSVTAKIAVYNAMETVQLLEDVPIAQIFNGSIQEMFISYNRQMVHVYLTVDIANPSCPVDIVVAGDLLALDAPLPVDVPSDLPILTGVIQPSAVLRRYTPGNSSSSVSLRVQRLALLPAYNTSDLIRGVLVPTSVSCASPNVTSPVPSFGYGTAQRLGASDVFLNVTLPIPSVDGSYSLCVGRLGSAFLSIGTLFIFAGNPAYLKLPLGDLTVGTPVTGVFVGTGLNASLDFAMATLWAHACSEGNLATGEIVGPLVDTGVDTVQWTVTFLEANIYRFCYQLRGSGTWQDVPSYSSLDLHSIENLEPASYSSSATPSTGASSLPPSTTPSTTLSPVPSTPAPTIAGNPGSAGCLKANASVVALFGSANVVRLELLGFTVGLKSYLSTRLCVDESNIATSALIQEGSSIAQYLVIYSRLGRYNGAERMSYLVYEFFPANANILAASFNIASMTAVQVSGAFVVRGPSSSSSGGAVAQLVIGVIVAGIVGFVLCTCGLMFLCCRRYTDRRISEARRRVAAEGVTVVVNHRGVQSQLVIARVTSGTGSDDDDSSSRRSTSDSDRSSMSAVEGTVVGGANGLFPAPRGEANALPDAAQVYGYRTEQLGYLPSPTTTAGAATETTAAGSAEATPGTPAPAGTTATADSSSIHRERPRPTQRGGVGAPNDVECETTPPRETKKSTDANTVVEISPFQVEEDE